MISVIAQFEFKLQNRLINTFKSKFQTKLLSGRWVISYLTNAVKACPGMSGSKDVDRVQEQQTCQGETPMVIGADNVNEI